MARRYRDRSSMSYEIVFQRQGHDVETIYWAGPLAETRELARGIAFKGGSDAFRINALTDCHDEGILAGTTVDVMRFATA